MARSSPLLPVTCLLQTADPHLILFNTLESLVGPLFLFPLCHVRYWRLISDNSTAAPKANSPGESDNGLKGVLTETTETDSPFTDSSSTLFSLYLSHAEKHDKEQAESWKAGADGILVFVRRISSHFSLLMSGN